MNKDGPCSGNGGEEGNEWRPDNASGSSPVWRAPETACLTSHRQYSVHCQLYFSFLAEAPPLKISISINLYDHMQRRLILS